MCSRYLIFFVVGGADNKKYDYMHFGGVIIRVDSISENEMLGSRESKDCSQAKS